MAAAQSDVCFTCKVAFKGRIPQVVPCFICHEVVHRTCLPEALTSTEYVRMKKYKEAFNFKCAACFHGTTSASVVSRKRKQPAIEPSSKRIRKDAEPSLPPLPRVARTRPSAIVPSALQESSVTQQQRNPPRVARTRPGAIVLSSRQETRVVVVTSTPLDEPLTINPVIPAHSPIEQPQTFTSVSVSVNIVITPSDNQQLLDWSSRYEIPVPIREDTVELRERAVVPVVPAARLVPYDSSDDDDVEEEEQYRWHVMDSALRQ